MYKDVCFTHFFSFIFNLSLITKCSYSYCHLHVALLIFFKFLYLIFKYLKVNSMAMNSRHNASHCCVNCIFISVLVD